MRELKWNACTVDGQTDRRTAFQLYISFMQFVCVCVCACVRACVCVQFVVCVLCVHAWHAKLMPGGSHDGGAQLVPSEILLYL